MSENLFNEKYFRSYLQIDSSTDVNNEKYSLTKVSNITIGHVLSAHSLGIFSNQDILRWIHKGRKLTPLIEKQFLLYKQLSKYLINSVNPEDVEAWREILTNKKYVWPTDDKEGWASVFGEVPDLCHNISLEQTIGNLSSDQDSKGDDSLNKSNLDENDFVLEVNVELDYEEDFESEDEDKVPAMLELAQDIDGKQVKEENSSHDVGSMKMLCTNDNIKKVENITSVDADTKKTFNSEVSKKEEIVDNTENGDLDILENDESETEGFEEDFFINDFFSDEEDNDGDESNKENDQDNKEVDKDRKDDCLKKSKLDKDDFETGKEELDYEENLDSEGEEEKDSDILQFHAEDDFHEEMKEVDERTPFRGNTFKIFCANLSDRATGQDLRKLFEPHGAVVEADVVKDYGFVHMVKEEDRKTAIEALNGHILHGKEMVVKASTENRKVGIQTTKIFVGDIHKDTKIQELRTLFQKYGTVVEADILTDIAFVHMDAESEAREAISELDGYVLHGLCLRVQESTSKVRKTAGMGNPDPCYSLINKPVKERLSFTTEDLKSTKECVPLAAESKSKDEQKENIETISNKKEDIEKKAEISARYKIANLTARNITARNIQVQKSGLSTYKKVYLVGEFASQVAERLQLANVFPINIKNHIGFFYNWNKFDENFRWLLKSKPRDALFILLVDYKSFDKESVSTFECNGQHSVSYIRIGHGEKSKEKVQYNLNMANAYLQYVQNLLDPELNSTAVFAPLLPQVYFVCRNLSNQGEINAFNHILQECQVNSQVPLLIPSDFTAAQKAETFHFMGELPKYWYDNILDVMRKNNVSTTLLAKYPNCSQYQYLTFENYAKVLENDTKLHSMWSGLMKLFIKQILNLQDKPEGESTSSHLTSRLSSNIPTASVPLTGGPSVSMVGMPLKIQPPTITQAAIMSTLGSNPPPLNMNNSYNILPPNIQNPAQPIAISQGQFLNSLQPRMSNFSQNPTSLYHPAFPPTVSSQYGPNMYQAFPSFPSIPVQPSISAQPLVHAPPNSFQQPPNLSNTGPPLSASSQTFNANSQSTTSKIYEYNHPNMTGVGLQFSQPPPTLPKAMAVPPTHISQNEKTSSTTSVSSVPVDNSVAKIPKEMCVAILKNIPKVLKNDEVEKILSGCGKIYKYERRPLSSDMCSVHFHDGESALRCKRLLNSRTLMDTKLSVVLPYEDSFTQQDKACINQALENVGTFVINKNMKKIEEDYSKIKVEIKQMNEKVAKAKQEISKKAEQEKQRSISKSSDESDSSRSRSRSRSNSRSSYKKNRRSRSRSSDRRQRRYRISRSKSSDRGRKKRGNKSPGSRHERSKHKDSNRRSRSKHNRRNRSSSSSSSSSVSRGSRRSYTKSRSKSPDIKYKRSRSRSTDMEYKNAKRRISETVDQNTSRHNINLNETNQFSVLGACQLLIGYCDKIGYLGHSLRAALEDVKKCGNNSSQIIKSLIQSEGQELLGLIVGKIKSLREATQDKLLQSNYNQAIIATNFLLKHIEFYLDVSKLDLDRSGNTSSNITKSNIERFDSNSNKNSSSTFMNSLNDVNKSPKKGCSVDYESNVSSSSHNSGSSSQLTSEEVLLLQKLLGKQKEHVISSSLYTNMRKSLANQDSYTYRQDKHNQQGLQMEPTSTSTSNVPSAISNMLSEIGEDIGSNSISEYNHQSREQDFSLYDDI